MLTKNRPCLLVLAATLLAAVVPLYTQEITGNISGTVTDASGAVVPEATVVVINVGTNVQRSTTSTAAGVFFFTSLPIGEYQLSVEKAGFKKSETTGISLHVNDKLNFPIALQVGQTTESVTVTGEAVMLQTETGEVSNLIGATQMQALPLNGRDFVQLVDLVPGIAADNGRVQAGGDTGVSVNGNQSNSNLYLIDGMFSEDNGCNCFVMVTPALDSIEEFKILRNNYGAEFGEATGGIINVITKSGNKDFHGSLYELLRNDALNANDFFSNRTGTPKSELRQHEFGGTVGGPIWIPGVYNKDRTKDFFFLSLQWRREIRGNILTDTVPSARQRRGTLNVGGLTPDPFEDPITDGEGNVPASQIDSNSAALLTRYPLPNANYAVNGFNFIASSPANSPLKHQAIRWDHNASEKLTIRLSYMQTASSSNNNGFWGDDNFPSVSSDEKYTAKLASLKVTYLISPRTVNDFQVGYSNNTISFKTATASDPQLASRAGFTYTELFPQTSGSFPSMGGVDDFGGLQHTAPFFNRTDNIQYKDDVSHVVGKHNLKAGFFLRFSRKREPANGGDDETAGSLSFKDFNNLLLGNILQYSEEQTLNEVPSRGRDVALYFQDTFKVRPNLTLDYGLRWQYLGQLWAAQNNIADFYPNRYDPSLCSVSAFSDGLVDPARCNVLNGIVTPKSPNVPRALQQPHYLDFEPRFGFSWDPLSNNKFVLRGGGGIYHGRDAFSQTSAAGRQPPFDLIPQLNNVSFTKLAAYNPDTPQPPVNLNVLDAVYHNPASYQYSFGFQSELMRETSIEINYVGSRQIHTGLNVNINQVPREDQLAIYQGLIDPNTVRPYLGFGIINVNERVGTSRYNSLQMLFNRRMRAGLQFQAAYTFQRALTDTVNGDSEGRASPVQDAFHPTLEKGLANQDQTHSLVFNYVWQIPFFQKSSPLAKAVFGGWQLNGITMFRSGQPVNVCLNSDYAGLGDTDVCERPNLVAKPNLSKSERTLARFFNTAAFVAPAAGTFGNAQRNLIRGPGINNWDASIFREFNFPWFGRHSGWAAAESATFRFEAGFFNTWNHTQFSSVGRNFVPQTDDAGNPIPGTTAANSRFGTVTGARGPREIQLGLKLMF